MLFLFLGDEHVERGDDEEGEDSADGHSPDEDEADGVAGGGTGADHEDKREVAEDGREAGHEDRAEAGEGGAADGFEFRVAIALQVVREFHDEDAVFCDEADERHEADLRVDVHRGRPSIGPEWHIRRGHS